MSPLTQYTINVDSLSYQLRQRHAATIDLLKVVTETSETITRGNTKLVLMSRYDVSNNYRFNYQVIVNGTDLGYISAHNISPMVGRGLLSFTLFNQALYTGFVGMMEQFLTDFELCPVNVTKIDIAVDSHVNVVESFITYFTQPDAYHYLYKSTGSQNIGINFAGKQYRSGEQSITLSPAISKDKKFRMYNKTEELKTSGKQYITEYHEANGLDITKPIYRVELVLTNEAFKSKELSFSRVNESTGEIETLSKYEYEQLPDDVQAGYAMNPDKFDSTPDYQRLGDSNYLLSVFNKYSQGLAMFAHRDNNQRTRCTKIKLLDLGEAKPLIPVKSITQNPTYQISMVHTFKTLVRSYYATNNELYLSTAQLLAKEHNQEAELAKQLDRLAHYRHQYQQWHQAQQQRPAVSNPL